MGFFALLLKYLSPFEALVCAFFAFIHNLYIFPLYGRRKIEKEFEKEKGYSGIVSYPAVVFLIILFSYLVSSNDIKIAMAIAAASWAVLAFGDSGAGFIGKAIGGAKLLWNKDKTWVGFFAFLFFSALFSYAFFNFVYFGSFAVYNLNLLILVCLSAIICGITESIKNQFDDNISFPFVAFSIFSFYPYFEIAKIKEKLLIFQLGEKSNLYIFSLLLFVNAVLALVAYLKKWVDKNGFLFGMVLGFAVILSLGLKGYLILLLFFAFANFSTFYGKEIKEKKGIGETNKGRRGLESVFSKGVAPLIFSFFSFESFALVLSFYASDTVATEFGKTSKGKTFSLLKMNEVPSGTRGGISFKGTFFGIIAILIFNFLSFFNYSSFEISFKFYLFATLLVILFFFLESIINEIDEKIVVTNKVVIHIVLGFLLGAFGNALFHKVGG